MVCWVMNGTNLISRLAIAHPNYSPKDTLSALAQDHRTVTGIAEALAVGRREVRGALEAFGLWGDGAPAPLTETWTRPDQVGNWPLWPDGRFGGDSSQADCNRRISRFIKGCEDLAERLDIPNYLINVLVEEDGQVFQRGFVEATSPRLERELIRKRGAHDGDAPTTT